MRLLLLMVWGSQAWGQGTPPPPPIVNGDTTTDFPAVVSLLLDNPQTGTVDHFCSGTVIHARWILTAAHCLTGLSNYQQIGATVWVAVGHDVSTEAGVQEWIQADRWEGHAGFNMSVLRDDIGLVELREPVLVTPIRLSEAIPDATWVGTELTYVGWGVTTDHSQDSGIKRMAEIPFDSADEQFIFGYDDTGQNVCYGDSGGAALRSEDNTWFLAGINSHVYPVQSNTGCVGGGSGATRVDQYLDWIAERVPLDENVYGPPPGLSNYVDDDDDDDEDARGGCAHSSAPAHPPSLLLLLLGAALAACQRRRRCDFSVTPRKLFPPER